MTALTPNSIAAYVLAGGESRRFGGNHDNKSKGLQKLDGQPLITHSLKRLKVQLNTININTHLADFTQFNYPIVSDDLEALYQGPLSGLLASMHDFHTKYDDKDWLLLIPCDSPFLPEDLVSSLISALITDQKNDQNIDQHLAVCMSYQGELQPTFSLWHKSLLNKIEDAVLNKQWGGLKIFFKHLGNAAHVVEYPEQIQNPFLNINNREELEKAEKLIQSRP